MWWIFGGKISVGFAQERYTPARNYCEINSENSFCVTEIRFSKKTIP